MVQSIRNIARGSRRRAGFMIKNGQNYTDALGMFAWLSKDTGYSTIRMVLPDHEQN